MDRLPGSNAVAGITGFEEKVREVLRGFSRQSGEGDQLGVAFLELGEHKGIIAS